MFGEHWCASSLVPRLLYEANVPAGIGAPPLDTTSDSLWGHGPSSAGMSLEHCAGQRESLQTQTVQMEWQTLYVFWNCHSCREDICPFVLPACSYSGCCSHRLSLDTAWHAYSITWGNQDHMFMYMYMTSLVSDLLLLAWAVWGLGTRLLLELLKDRKHYSYGKPNNTVWIEPKIARLQ